MNFNRCSRCGNFFANAGSLCPNCATKDIAKIKKLENYLEMYSMPNSLQELSSNTGISQKDLARYIQQNTRFSNLNGI